MSVDARIAAFLQLAQEELTAARSLRVTGRRQSAYFCQQSAEKIARAILAHAGALFSTGHNSKKPGFSRRRAPFEGDRGGSLHTVTLVK